MRVIDIHKPSIIPRVSSLSRHFRAWSRFSVCINRVNFIMEIRAAPRATLRAFRLSHVKQR